MFKKQYITCDNCGAKLDNIDVMEYDNKTICPNCLRREMDCDKES